MADWREVRIGSTQFGWPVGAPGTAVHNLSASDSGVGFAVQCKDTNAITHLGFRYGTATGTPPTYVVGLEGVSSTTGQPSGAYLQSGGIDCKATFTPPSGASWDGTWQWVTLAQSYTPSQGEMVAITIRYSSGTVNVSNFSSIANEASNLISSGISSDPYSLRLTTGSWSKRNTLPLWGIRTASTRYGNVYQGNYTTQTASTVGQRSAMKFTLPSGSFTSVTVKGIRFYGVLAGAAGKNPILGIWDGSGSIVTRTLDTDLPNSPASRFVREYMFGSVATLTPGTTYYAGLEVADATSAALGIAGITLSEANDQLAFPWGTAACISVYASGAWTDDTTVRPFCELIVDDVTASAGTSPLFNGLIVGNIGTY